MNLLMKSIRTGVIINFDDEKSGTVVDSWSSPYKVGSYLTNLISVTRKDYWLFLDLCKKKKLLNSIKDFK